MSVRYSYNQQVTPPAPFVHVTLSRPTASEVRVTQVPALVDTGADLSVIPFHIVEKLRLVPLDQIFIEGFSGGVTSHTTFLVDATIHNLPTVSLRVLAHPEESYMLLGRDLLNQFEVVLNGPKLFVDLLQD